MVISYKIYHTLLVMMTNRQAEWALLSIATITLMLITASVFTGSVLAVKKSSASSVKTIHETPSKPTTTTVAHSHIRGVKLLSFHTIPSKVAVGQTFSLGGLVFNNSSATITFANGTCAPSPLSVTFNKNAVPETQAAAASCKPQQATLKPGEHSQMVSPNLSAIIYRATAAGTTNATMIFKYGVEIPTIKSPISDSVSRTYAFGIQPGSQQPPTTSTITTTTPVKTTSEPGPLKQNNKTSPLTAAAPAPVHTAAYWFSKWYESHPQYHPTASEIKSMRANPQDVVPGYTIPLTAAAPGGLNSTTTNTTTTAPVNK
jgi:hypothetical protein